MLGSYGGAACSASAGRNGYRSSRSTPPAAHLYVEVKPGVSVFMPSYMLVSNVVRLAQRRRVQDWGPAARAARCLQHTCCTFAVKPTARVLMPSYLLVSHIVRLAQRRRLQEWALQLVQHAASINSKSQRRFAACHCFVDHTWDIFHVLFHAALTHVTGLIDPWDSPCRRNTSQTNQHTVPPPYSNDADACCAACKRFAGYYPQAMWCGRTLQFCRMPLSHPVLSGCKSNPKRIGKGTDEGR